MQKMTEVALAIFSNLPRKILISQPKFSLKLRKMWRLVRAVKKITDFSEKMPIYYGSFSKQRNTFKTFVFQFQSAYKMGMTAVFSGQILIGGTRLLGITAIRIWQFSGIPKIVNNPLAPPWDYY